MAFAFQGVLLLLFFGVIGFCGFEGLWSNVIRWINVMLATLLSFTYFEPLAGLMEGFVDSAHYHVDAAALCLIFGISMGVFRTITDMLSKVKLKFPPLIDRLGGIVLSIWTGWIVVGFILVVMHAAPLERNFFWGGYRPGANMVLGGAPDVMLLSFMHQVSQGSLAQGVDDKNPTQFVFDPAGSFLPRYASRRKEYEGREDLFSATEKAKKSPSKKGKSKQAEKKKEGEAE